ncbi:unnamed protein product [Zymoseptoria tritici ST99CH_1A5]|uniref:Uncharacterized protein n=1 Tax=Zymoseptoria tritici ST99CH_1A5 TaxID=1276529 RepID=A0A1Y6M5G9_ZYMTR|nr:unnamed protein product [Zymoseptoria tritici ST99CH_1A5]
MLSDKQHARENFRNSRHSSSTGVWLITSRFPCQDGQKADRKEAADVEWNVDINTTCWMSIDDDLEHESRSGGYSIDRSSFGTTSKAVRCPPLRRGATAALRTQRLILTTHINSPNDAPVRVLKSKNKRGTVQWPHKRLFGYASKA